MINLSEIKITPRDEQVLKLLVQGCSNKEIATHLNISPRTVKQHLRTLFLRAGIRDGRKRVKLATAMFGKEQTNHATSGAADSEKNASRILRVAGPAEPRERPGHRDYGAGNEALSAENV